MDRGRTLGDETSPMVPATTPRPMGGPGGNRVPAGQRTPRTKARPEERKPQNAKRKGLPPKGGQEHRRGFRTLGLGYSLSYRGSAYAGCLAPSSMSSMATAIRMGTMRCWGPRGPKTEPFPVSQEILTLITLIEV